MRASRRLVLRKETLAELTPGDLAQVIGGQATQPIGNCLGISDKIQCDSLLRPCITYTCTR
jgi:hypothetical protein